MQSLLFILQIFHLYRLLVETLKCAASDGQNLQGVPSNVTHLFATSSLTKYSLFVYSQMWLSVSKVEIALYSYVMAENVEYLLTKMFNY